MCSSPIKLAFTPYWIFGDFFLIFGPISGKYGPAKIFVVVTDMESTMLISSSLKAKLWKHTMFGNILQLQIILKQRKVAPRMLNACFVINLSVGAVHQEQLHISWRVLS